MCGLTIIDLVHQVSAAILGRDELGHEGHVELHSLSSWLIVRCGLEADEIHPLRGGRVPGWEAGHIAAGRAAAGMG